MEDSSLVYKCPSGSSPREYNLNRISNDIESSLNQADDSNDKNLQSNLNMSLTRPRLNSEISQLFDGVTTNSSCNQSNSSMQNFMQLNPIPYNEQCGNSFIIDGESYNHANNKAISLPWFSDPKIELTPTSFFEFQQYQMSVLNSDESLSTTFDDYINNYSTYALFPCHLLPPLPPNALEFHASQPSTSGGRNCGLQYLPTYDLSHRDLYIYSTSPSCPRPHAGIYPDCSLHYSDSNNACIYHPTQFGQEREVGINVMHHQPFGSQHAFNHQPFYSSHNRPNEFMPPTETLPAYYISEYQKSLQFQVNSLRRIESQQMSNDQSLQEDKRKIGDYTIAERIAKIKKFRMKREKARGKHTVKYDCRRKIAETRPRVNGRFAKTYGNKIIERVNENEQELVGDASLFSSQLSTSSSLQSTRDIPSSSDRPFIYSESLETSL